MVSASFSRFSYGPYRVSIGDKRTPGQTYYILLSSVEDTKPHPCKALTWSCASETGQWRTPQPPSSPLTCVRQQRHSRGSPSGGQLVSGRRPVQTATGSEDTTGHMYYLGIPHTVITFRD